MQFIEDELRQLTPAIWDAVLQLPLSAETDFPQTEDSTISACIHITGAWNGAIAVSCDLDFAATAAGIMFDLGDGVPTTADMQDALGELTNMIGGNVKALLPGECCLSLPSAVEGVSYSVRILHSKVVTRVPFRTGEHSMTVSIHERDKAA